MTENTSPPALPPVTHPCPCADRRCSLNAVERLGAKRVYDLAADAHRRGHPIRLRELQRAMGARDFVGRDIERFASHLVTRGVLRADIDRDGWATFSLVTPAATGGAQ